MRDDPLRGAARRAFELAFSTTYMFAGSRPEFLLVDEVRLPFCHVAPGRQ